MSVNEASACELMKRCPRFDNCNAPICLLDPLQDQRTYLSGEPHCRLSKKRRLELASGSDLPRQGMTKREYAATMRQQSLSPSDRQRQLSNLKQSRANNRDGGRK